MVDFLAHWQGIQLIDFSHISNIHLLKFIDTARQIISQRVRIYFAYILTKPKHVLGIPNHLFLFL